MTHSKIIREWLSDYKTLREEELATFASTLVHHEDLKTALSDLFEDEIIQEVVEPVCNQLCEFYRSRRRELRHFTMELVPLLLSCYLQSMAAGEKRKCGGVEVLLLELYNLEVVDEDGKAKTFTTRIPTLAQSSIYHEPPSLATIALTESALTRYHSDEPVLISAGLLPQVETLTGQNRFAVLTYILHCYNAVIGKLSTRSHQKLCKMASSLTQMGFDGLECESNDSFKSVSSNPSTPDVTSKRENRGIKFKREPRVPLSSGFLVELLNGIYYAMFNGQTDNGLSALEDIHTRAEYELLSDVLMVTNAIKNSLTANPSGQPQDGPIGISIALSPTTTNPAFAKHAITNASFRAKKLPEDIEVPDEDQETGSGSHQAPPDYHEIVEQDRAHQEAERYRSGAAKITKPIKSIMKNSKSPLSSKASQSQRKDHEKKHESWSDSREGGQSPRSSRVMHGSSSANAELSSIQVEIIKSNSYSHVDTIELPNLPTETTHERTPSFTEGLHATRPTSLEGVSPTERTAHFNVTEQQNSDDSFESSTDTHL